MIKKITQSDLGLHEKWLNNEPDGVRLSAVGAYLYGANLGGADLRGADLYGADLSKANLSWANLGDANLSGAKLYEADLSEADLRGADLSWAKLSEADLSRANLSWANLSKANLSGANLSWANLSGAAGLLNCMQWMRLHFEHDDLGWIVYKTFGAYYTVNKNWDIKPNAYIEENVNPLPTNDCGCGINFGTLEWIKKNFGTRELPVWRCRIEWEDACSIVVPYNTDGKARCGRMQLLEVVE